MWVGLVVVVMGSIVAGASLRGLSWARRRRMTSGVDEDTIVRAARGVSLRILASGATALPSMSTTKANRSVGDLVVTSDRLLIVCSRGTLVDIRPDRGRPLRSVRSPGPGRLIVEGGGAADTVEADGYRIETVVDDAAGWVRELERFTGEGNGGYGTALTA